MPSVTATASSPSVWMSSASVPAQATKQKGRVDPIASDNDTPDKPNPIKLQPLCLPSEISIRLSLVCQPGLDDIERKMWDTQCESSLDHVWTLLYIEFSLGIYKSCNARAQKQNTCAHATLSQKDAKIKVFQDKYNMVRVALIALGADKVVLEWKMVEDGDL